MDFREMRVSIGELELDGIRDFGPAASDLRKRVFESVNHVDANAVLGLRHRIEDRLAAPFGNALHHHAAAPSGYDGFNIDRRKDRRMHFFEGGSENIKNCRAWLGILSAEDTKQSGALRFRGSLIDDHSCFAFAFVNRAGPAEDSDKLQAVEIGRTVITLLDLHAGHCQAMAMGRQAIK